MSGIEVISQFLENIRPRYSWSQSSDSSASSSANSNNNNNTSHTQQIQHDTESSDSLPVQPSSTPRTVDPDPNPANEPEASKIDNNSTPCHEEEQVSDSLPLATLVDNSVEEDLSRDLQGGLPEMRSSTVDQQEMIRQGRRSPTQFPSHVNGIGPPMNNSTTVDESPLSDEAPTAVEAPMMQSTAQQQLLDAGSLSGAPDPFFARQPNGTSASALPEDDGNSALRQRVIEIQQSNITERERAERMHLLMTENYHASRPHPTTTTLSGSGGSKFRYESKLNDDCFTAEDIAPSYFNEAQGILGCTHYRRGVKLQCFTCEKWYPCRFCHDEKEDHVLVRKDTKNMMCMHCGKAQPAQQSCKQCGKWMSRYYCDKCKLWDDDPLKTIYHCNDCGICRIGRGLGKDFFHCKKCGVCMSIELEGQHRCIERSTDCDCPICGEYMFTSVMTVVFMTCGHSIHHKCYYEHMKNSYRCPTCSRSVLNMETQFRFLDHEISCQPLPDPYKNWHCHITCNDCSAKSDVPFHFLGLKCDTCKSYNTREVKLIRPEEDDGQPVQNTPFSIMPDPETAGTIMYNRGVRQEPVVTDLASVIREIDVATQAPSDSSNINNTRRPALSDSVAMSSSQILPEDASQPSENNLQSARRWGVRSCENDSCVDIEGTNDCESASETDSECGTDDDSSSSASFEIIRLPFHP